MDEEPITIVEYDPAWPAHFEEERELIGQVLNDYTNRIEHIGSTSVRELGAKPIIDITAVVTDLDGVWGNVDKLVAGLGYSVSHVPGDWLLLQRADDTEQMYNLHLITEANHQWRTDLLFREFLRANPAVREKYETVKREAAKAHPNDIDAYNQEKADFCRSVLSRAKSDDSIQVPREPTADN